MKGAIAVVLGLACALASGGARSAGAVLKPLAGGGEPSAQSLEAASGLTEIALFPKQSFELWAGSRRLGVVAAGSGRVPNAAGAPVCFVAFVREGGAQVVKTVGQGDWEAETCLDVAVMGALKGVGADLRVTVIFKAASPNTEALEPVVVRIPASASDSISVDAAATKAASLAGAVTVRDVQRALNR